MLSEKKIKEFLEELASERPTPGGGSVAALAGALSAGLCSMVGKLSEAEKMKEYGEKAERFQKVLMGLIDEDAEAFKAVMEAYQLPKTTEEEKKERKEKIEEALKRAVEAPLKTARYSYEVLKLAEILAEEGNPRAISDVGTAAVLCGASIKSALLNVEINLASINDEEFKEEIEKGTDKVSDYLLKVAETTNTVYRKMGQD